MIATLGPFRGIQIVRDRQTGSYRERERKRDKERDGGKVREKDA